MHVWLGEEEVAEEYSYCLPVPELERKWCPIPLGAERQQEEGERSQAAGWEILARHKDSVLHSEGDDDLSSSVMGVGCPKSVQEF